MTATESTDTDAGTHAVTGVPFTLNGKEVEATDGELLIAAAERHGVHIPRFCYHSRMSSVGMCRMCLVEVDTGRGPALQPSCMLPVTPNMVVETESDASKHAQDGVLELLLINHPLDCPVCDKGGECPLQDNTISFGPGESRFVEEKRHFEKPIPISDLVHLDRERCILCDRCTRFADEVAGDPLIQFIDRGAATQVNTFPDHPFSSYFSGNTVQICPVGALTAAPYRFKARPWDLSAVESTATVDSTGARVALQSSGNEMVRVLGVDSDAVNWGWLSDKDRFTYEATLSPSRITEPLLSAPDDVVNDANDAATDGLGHVVPTRWNDAIKAAARALNGEPERIAAIGGARLSLEDQYAWSKLLKGVIGTDHVDCQLGDGIPASMALGLPRATINQACQPGGVVLLLAADPKEELPTLYLRLRHAVVNDGVSLIEVTPRPTSLSNHAAVRLHPLPGTAGQVLGAVADGAVDEPLAGIEAEDLAAVRDLLASDRPVTVVFGRPNLAESARYTADAVGHLLQMVPDVRFLPALRRGNVMGGLEMGLSPSFLPGGIRRTGSGPELPNWSLVPDFVGRDATGILRLAAAGDIDTLVLLGADPLADFPDADLARQALDQVDTIIAIDAFPTASVAKADVILPAALAGEKDGTFLNLEGRLSPLRAKVTGPGQAQADWVIAAEIAAGLGSDLGFVTLDELRHELSHTASSLHDIDLASLGSADDGPALDLTRQWVLEFGDTANPPPASNGPDTGGTSEGGGRGGEPPTLRLVVDRKLWDLGTMVTESASLRDLPPTAVLRLAPTDLPAFGLIPGELATVGLDDKTLDVAFEADPGVRPGTAWLQFRLPGPDVRDLLKAGRGITTVSVTPVGSGSGSAGSTGNGEPS